MCDLFFRWGDGFGKICRTAMRKKPCKAIHTFLPEICSQGAMEKNFEKKFLRPLSFSVYTNPRSKERKRIACLGS